MAREFECPSCHARTPHVTGLCPTCGHIGRGTEITDRCSVPGCNRPHRAKGLCSSHYKARAEGRPLAPLREVSEVRREVVSFRLDPKVRAAVQRDPEGARAALIRWAK